MKKSAVAIIYLLACTGFAAAQPTAVPRGSWVGAIQYTSGAGFEAFPISVDLRGNRAIVALGGGHAAKTEVPARITGTRVRFSLPGRPARLVFDGRLKNRRLTGTFHQGVARGRFGLRRGRPLEAGSLGLYRFADGRPLGVVAGFGLRTAFPYEEGEIRALYEVRPGSYAIGAGSATRNPPAGTAAFSAGSALWRSERAAKVALRQEEVLVRSGRANLACTLTIPPGSGRRPALAFAHGGGPAPRASNSVLALYANHLGLVTLSCDKRGVAQSGGRYPGSSAGAAEIDQYAVDVQAQARWLAAQPEVDPARVGVAGGSQAGWIMPLAAAREPAIRFVVGLVPPTLTQGETDLWATLNDQGRSAPMRTDDDMEAEVRRAGPSGVDPMPSIRALRIPALWLFGGKDRIVPSRLCIERLDPVTREPGRDLSYRLFPGGTHSLILTENGLIAEAERSNRMVVGLWPAIRDWLRARGLVSGIS
jgi:dienelactone hydrolase